MGLIYTNITLSNPKDNNITSLDVRALADTGAITLCIPEHIAIQLKLETIEQREVTTANGQRQTVPYVGPVQLQFGNRSCFTGALVMGDSVLFGAIPMEDMDLVLTPSRQQITVNPQSPNIPSAVVKTAA